MNSTHEAVLADLARLALRAPSRAAFFDEAAARLQRAVPHDGACWHTLDPGSDLVTQHRDKLDAIAHFKQVLTDDRVRSANPSRGRATFARVCAQCHTLYGVGGKVGPEITGANRSSIDYLLENMGLILFPSMNDEVGAITLTHPLAYMISSKSEHPDVAMALIAAVTTPEINNLHAIGSFHLGILQSQAETADYIDNPAISQAHYMLDHTTNIPNDPGWNAWSNAWWLAIQAVESGESTAAEAVELAVTQLTNELGDKITIR